MIKKITTLVFGTLLFAVNAQAVTLNFLQESEPNNSFGTANLISASPLVSFDQYYMQGVTNSSDPEFMTFSLGSKSNLWLTNMYGLLDSYIHLYDGQHQQVGITFFNDTQLTYQNLNAGTYFVEIASYSAKTVDYKLAIGSIAAVPEPETYAMMIGGFGMVSLMARRRKKAIQ